MSGVAKRKVSRDEADMRLDRWFKLHYPLVSHILLIKLLRKGQIRVDGGRVKSSQRLIAGQEIRIPPLMDNAKGQLQAKPVRPPLSREERKNFSAMILHEDDDLIVINKPSGLAVQGGTGTKRHIDDLLQGLAHELHDRPRLVHRLDRDTSGVLLIAKKRNVAAQLGRLFSTRSVHKIYWTLACGIIRPPQGKFTKPLIKTGSVGNEKMRVAKLSEPGAQKAITHYSVIDQAGDRMSWLSLKPVTGRQHQLRAHLAFNDTPILGDLKYGATRDGFEAVPDRLYLHARRIILPHPSGGTLDVTAPLASDMEQGMRFFGFDPDRFDSDKDMVDS